MVAISSQFYFISSHFRKHFKFAMKLSLFILVCICMFQLSLEINPSESTKDSKTDAKDVKEAKGSDNDQEKNGGDPNEGNRLMN